MEKRQKEDPVSGPGPASATTEHCERIRFFPQTEYSTLPASTPFGSRAEAASSSSAATSTATTAVTARQATRIRAPSNPCPTMAQPNPSLAVPFNTSALDSDSDWDHANGIQRFVSHQQIHSMEDSLEFEDLDGGFLFSASEEDDEHLSQHDDMEEEEQIDGGGGAFDGDASERETEDAFRNLHPQPHFHNRRSFHQRHHANRASLTPILLCDSTISLPSSDEVIIVSSSLPPRANDNVTSQSSTLQARNQQTDEQGANHTIRPTRRVIQRLSSHDLNQDPDTSVEFVSQSFAVFDTPERLERIGRTSQHHNEFTLYSELQRQRQRQLRSLHEASGSGSISSSSASSSSSANRFGTLIPSHVQGHGEPQLANSPDTEPEDDSDLTLARRLQEEEYQVLQSSNVEENVQRLFGILQDGDEEGPQPLIPSDDDSSEDGTIQNVFTSALSEYRESQRARHLESHLDAAEARVASTRRSRRRALPASDDDDDDEWALRALMGASGDGGAGVSVRSSRGRPARGRRGRGARSDGEDQLVRMEFGALFGAGGHERPWLPPVGGRGLMNGVMAGLIPELFG
ncbi:hypothetical protein BC830DRAFT_1175495 [Chytriomyces sp. MP71]|nr:hypothetical protein BC830DRAFT_1175495 [Chytriomyces sp. MP71]